MSLWIDCCNIQVGQDDLAAQQVVTGTDGSLTTRPAAQHIIIEDITAASGASIETDEQMVAGYSDTSLVCQVCASGRSLSCTYYVYNGWVRSGGILAAMVHLCCLMQSNSARLQICNKVTKDENELTEHLLAHDDNAAHSRMKRVHKCHDCGKLFDKPSQLERHLRIHTGLSAKLNACVWSRQNLIGKWWSYHIVFGIRLMLSLHS